MHHSLKFPRHQLNKLFPGSLDTGALVTVFTTGLVGGIMKLSKQQPRYYWKFFLRHDDPLSSHIRLLIDSLQFLAERQHFDNSLQTLATYVYGYVWPSLVLLADRTSQNAFEFIVRHIACHDKRQAYDDDPSNAINLMILTSAESHKDDFGPIPAIAAFAYGGSWTVIVVITLTGDLTSLIIYLKGRITPPKSKGTQESWEAQPRGRGLRRRFSANEVSKRITFFEVLDTRRRANIDQLTREQMYYLQEKAKGKLNNVTILREFQGDFATSKDQMLNIPGLILSLILKVTAFAMIMQNGERLLAVSAGDRTFNPPISVGINNSVLCSWDISISEVWTIITNLSQTRFVLVSSDDKVYLWKAQKLLDISPPTGFRLRSRSMNIL
ncbi:uncharacterized protein EDB93DRAFT_1340432 [Suillus bovinus]|uniref:uncharacterized protein n=1 Tax=Suillus bovinus TaxID=48563 RepID=UPI001B886759|nr:uncharacterized protein EDB93DRAFT_1340432 [Suillus bovinus]KAG2130633.1 hypothetical protein EDB93DRAFT_1340432 [Suillus bovinus]